MPRNKEEAIAAGVKVRETQHSMKRRKPWHDYHRKGTYMLTLVVAGRQPMGVPHGAPHHLPRTVSDAKQTRGRNR